MIFPRFSHWKKRIGKKTYCSVCDVKNVTFDPLPDSYRLNAERHGYTHFGQGEMTALDTYSCGKCGASDRERLYAYWLKNTMGDSLYPKKEKAIHFAPEHAFSNFIKRENIFTDYQTADLLMTDVTHAVDLMNLPFADESYDFFICSHVLEHVSDDRKAIRELFRVLRRGGQGILMAPIIVGLQKTIEDPSITDEDDRWRLFGQNDHVRLYAHDDYVARIESCGFELRHFDETYFGKRLFGQLGLKPTSTLYVVAKP
jgi:SAM-dependent methyltransferase